MKQFLKILELLGVIVLVILLSAFVVYKINTGKVSNQEDSKEIMIEQGYTYNTISKILKENNLIKSELFYKIYIKLHKPESLQAGRYYLSENMSVKEVVDVLSKGSTYNPDVIRITFKEGINMRKIASLIAENTNNTVDQVYAVLKDENYLNQLISDYWFITDSIKNKKIYYSLEGYLFPDTYEFLNKDASVKDIFAAMLNQMNKKLSPYREKLEASSYSVHEILTLASIVELEGTNRDDRAGVAGVFYNRLKNKWSLGSDVTTYYAAKVDMSERDLYQSEINEYNAYNTRNANMAGKLPVGPICIPSLVSIVATLEPDAHDYYYFVADKYKKTYFTKTYNQHLSTISKLKAEGLWYEY